MLPLSFRNIPAAPQQAPSTGRQEHRQHKHPSIGSKPGTEQIWDLFHDQLQKEQELDHPPVLLASSSSSPDKVIVAEPICPFPDDFKTHQKLFTGMAMALDIHWRRSRKKVTQAGGHFDICISNQNSAPDK